MRTPDKLQQSELRYRLKRRSYEATLVQSAKAMAKHRKRSVEYGGSSSERIGTYDIPFERDRRDDSNDI